MQGTLQTHLKIYEKPLTGSAAKCCHLLVLCINCNRPGCLVSSTFQFISAPSAVPLQLVVAYLHFCRASYVVIEPVATAGGGAQRRGVVVSQGLRRPVLRRRGIDVVEGQRL